VRSLTFHPTFGPTMPSESTSKVRIREAALTLFARGGLDALTMRSIAAEVGVSATAIYRHYPNRNAILSDVCVHGFRAFAQMFEEPIEVADCNERIQTIGNRYLTWAINNRELFDLLHQYDALQKAKRLPRMEAAEEGATSAIKVLVREVERCISSGAWRKQDPWIVALTLWASARGTYTLFWTGRMGVTEEQLPVLFRSCVSMMIKGLEAPALST
jgi:AcrR family transcriptional regulator